jgi:methylglutaconyl-CoA hydratase
MKSGPVAAKVQQNGVATVTLNRPEVHNALDDVTIAGLTATLRELDADGRVRVVILAGEGKTFCAGADLNWMRRTADYSEQENVRDAQAVAEMLRVLDELSKPTVAAVHAAAFGGGVGLVACSDITIAAEDAEFCLSEVRLGLIPAVISPYVIRAIGPRQARRYFLTAQHFSAAEARRIGLVHEVVPAAGLAKKAEEVSAALLQGGPNALTAAKALIARVAGQPMGPTTMQYTAERIAAVRASSEGREGMSAFLEKRRPKWRP